MNTNSITIGDISVEGSELSDEQLLAVRGGLMAIRSTCVPYPPTGAFDED